MADDVLQKAIGFLVFLAIYAGFVVRGQIQANRTVDPSKDFVIVYQQSFSAIFLSVIGVFILFGGALFAATSTGAWGGVLIAGLGLLMIYYRFHTHRKFVLRQGAITCVGGAGQTSTLNLSEVSGFVLVTAEGVSFLGIETEAQVPKVMPTATWVSKSFFNENPLVKVVFSSEAARLKADALLNEIQARMSETVPVVRKDFGSNLTLGL